MSFFGSLSNRTGRIKELGNNGLLNSFFLLWKLKDLTIDGDFNTT